MRPLHHATTPLLVAVLFMFSSAYAAAAPNVVVSIRPIHSLVAGIMGDVGQPHLLLKQAASPHDYRLTPSNARQLFSADLIILIDDTLETFLRRPLKQLTDKTQLLKLLTQPGLETYPYRLDMHTEHAHAHAHDAASIDPHIWLDPINAKQIVVLVRDRLIKIDPENAPNYRHNAATVNARLDSLHRELQSLLSPVHHVPFLMFHDAWQYLERRYDLNAAAALSFDPRIKPGAKKLHQIYQIIERQNIGCLFQEPQFVSPLVQMISRDTQVKIGILDPMGISPSPAAADDYFDMMLANSQQLNQCLLQQADKPLP